MSQKKRVYLTPAEKLAKAKREQVNTVTNELLKAVNLEDKAEAWTQRAEELIEKAEGARKLSIGKLTGIGMSKDDALTLLRGERGREEVVAILAPFGVTEQDLIDKGVLPKLEED